VLFLAVYPIPENTLPAAPWPDGPPQYLRWKLLLALVLFGLAGACALAALALSHGRARPRAAALAAWLALGSVTASVAVNLIVTLQWAEAVVGAADTVALVAAVSLLAATLFARAGLILLRTSRYGLVSPGR
jgi:hypothetical protein